MQLMDMAEVGAVVRGTRRTNTAYNCIWWHWWLRDDNTVMIVVEVGIQRFVTRNAYIALRLSIQST